MALRILSPATDGNACRADNGRDRISIQPFQRIFPSKMLSTSKPARETTMPYKFWRSSSSSIRRTDPFLPYFHSPFSIIYHNRKSCTSSLSYRHSQSPSLKLISQGLSVFMIRCIVMQDYGAGEITALKGMQAVTGCRTKSERVEVQYAEKKIWSHGPYEHGSILEELPFSRLTSNAPTKRCAW